MLGLAQQVCGTQFAIYRVVGNDQGLRRTGQEVDTDASEELTLGLGDIGVAGAYQHVDRLEIAARRTLGSERHQANGLYAAKRQDGIRARHVLGHHDSRTGLPPIRRGGRQDPLDPRHLGRDHSHVCGGHKRILAARHIGPDRIYRCVPMTEDHARQGLDLDVLQRVLLDLGKVPDLCLGEGNIVNRALRQGGVSGADFVLAQAEVFAVPFVQVARIAADSLKSLRLDVAEHPLDRFTNAVAIGLDRLYRASFLQPTDHRNLLQYRHGRLRAGSNCDQSMFVAFECKRLRARMGGVQCICRHGWPKPRASLHASW